MFFKYQISQINHRKFHVAKESVGLIQAAWVNCYWEKSHLTLKLVVKQFVNH